MANQKLIISKMTIKPKLNLTNAPRLLAENKELRAKLREAEETLRAIQSGDVDAVVVSGPKGEQVFALKGAEYAYRELVEAMNEGAATLSADGIVLYCNDQVGRLLQRPEKVIGKSVQQFIAESDRQTFAGLFQRALTGEACKAEILFQAQAGTTAPAHVSLSKLPEHAAAAVCMVVTDLREQKERDELIAAGSLAQSILEHAAEAIAVCNEQGQIILANEALRALCGRNPVFEHFDQVLPLEVAGRRLSGESAAPRFSVSAALGGKSIKGQEVSFRRHEDRRADAATTVWLLLSAGRLREGDRVSGCVLTLTDVSKRRAAERALLRSEKLAATGQLAATIAHEINNPLAAIFNLLYLIEQEPRRDQIQKLVGQATGELSRVSHIAKQTLAFYRESSQPEGISIAEMLDEILGLFKKEFQARHVTVGRKYEIPGEIQAYPGEMRQVFSNLLRNSLEAVPEGGQIHLHIRRARHGGKEGVGIFISDNGSGIPADIRSRIFEPFFTTKGQKGTGLGLWVAKDLVEKHGGAIRVRSSALPGHIGTCFCVFLPSAAKKEALKAAGLPGVERRKREV